MWQDSYSPGTHGSWWSVLFSEVSPRPSHGAPPSAGGRAGHGTQGQKSAWPRRCKTLAARSCSQSVDSLPLCPLSHVKHQGEHVVQEKENRYNKPKLKSVKHLGSRAQPVLLGGLWAIVRLADGVSSEFGADGWFGVLLADVFSFNLT